MELLDEYEDHEFPDEAVAEVAATFGGRQQMLIAAGVQDSGAEKTGMQLLAEWKSISRKYDVYGEAHRKSLVLQGLEMYLEDSREQAVAEMAHYLEGL